MKFFRIAVPAGLVLLCVEVSAQQSLSLMESIELASEKSYRMQNVSERYVAAKKTFEATALSLRTAVDLQLSMPNYSESLSSQFNPLTQRYEFYQISTTRVQSTLSLQQPVVWTGGTLSLSGFVFGRDQTSGLTGSQKTVRDYFSNFFVSYTQPLLTPNLHKLTLERAEISLSQAESDYVRAQLDIIYDVTEAFYAVYQNSQRVEFSRELVKQNEEAYQTAQNKLAAGLIPEVEMLQSEVDLVASRNDLLNLERELARAQNSFKLLVGISLQDEVILRTDLSHKSVRISPELAVRKALENRTDLMSTRRMQELRELEVDVAKSRRDFRFDVTATYGLNRNDASFSDVFNDFGRTRSVSLTVSVPLFDWGRNSREVEAAEAEHKSAMLTVDNLEQQIRQEILDLVNRIRVAGSRIQVLEKSVDVAQKGYDINLERFRTGTITRNDLAQAQQRLATAKVNNLAALVDYQLGLADLRRRTLWDFERNEPVRVSEFEKVAS